MASDRHLGEFEQLVLLAILRLASDAYGMKIRQEIEARTGRKISIGAVYATLERMERKGFVSSAQGDPTPERGGRAKKFYKIQAPGHRALDAALAAVEQMRSGLAAGLRPVPSEV